MKKKFLFLIIFFASFLFIFTAPRPAEAVTIVCGGFTCGTTTCDGPSGCTYHSWNCTGKNTSKAAACGTQYSHPYSASCNPTCPSKAPYACNTTTHTCSQSASGTYSTKSACDTACAAPVTTCASLSGTCKAAYQCTSDVGTVSQTNDCKPGICCTPVKCAGTCKAAYQCTSDVGTVSQTDDCKPGICCTPKAPQVPPDATNSTCMQCPAGYDTFWNCPFRIGDIPPDQACCHKDMPFSTPTYSPLVACSASCNIVGGCNADGTYKLKCGYDPANPTAVPICDTAIGKIETTVAGFINSLFAKILGIIGGIAVLLIIISGYRLMASQGNPEKVQGAKEQLTAAIIGLLFVIFSLVILQMIGYDILKLPGFKP